jgi:cobalamin synthase
MVGTNTIALGIVIVLAFVWRFTRIRQLYLTSLHVQACGSEPILFNPHDLRSFVQQAILGRRSIKPTSFFIRAFVFVVVAACLFPFKDYEPSLYWLVMVLIALYVPWCIVHGVMLKKRLPDSRAK